MRKFSYQTKSSSRQHYFPPKDFNPISVPELLDNSHNKATMVYSELNVGEVDDGNWSDKDIVIAYVHLLKCSSSIQ